MEAYEAIMTRRSIRSYTEQRISEEDVEKILKAGMSGPSCANTRPWTFIVVRDRDMLAKMADANGKPAQVLKRATLGILVCGDLERAFPKAQDYWIIDCAIAGENMTLAAHALGIGSVWLGTYPQMDRVQNQRELFGLPDTMIPHSVFAFGYHDAEAAPDRPVRAKIEFEADRVHYESW